MSGGEWVLVALLCALGLFPLVLVWRAADRDFDAAMRLANDIAALAERRQGGERDE